MYRIFNKKKLWATMVADAVGHVVTAPFRLLRRREPVRPEAVREILVLRTAYVGDVIMTLPLLAPLRERFPGARITFLTSRAAAPLLRGHPGVDEVLAHDPFWFYPTPKADYLPFVRELRRRRFDLVIEARADIRDILFLVQPLKARYKVSYAVGGGGFCLTHVVPHPRVNHRVEYHLDIARFLGCRVDASRPEWGLRLTPEEEAEVDSLLRGAGITGPFWCGHPGSRVPLKRWADARYARCFDMVAAQTGLKPVLLGAPSEAAGVRTIAAAMGGDMGMRPVDLSGRLSLRLLAGVLARAELLVCNDSAPMHLAVAMGTPVVALFGPSKSDQTGPWSPVARVVEKDFPCRRTCDESRCRHTECNACMTSLTPEDVLEAVRGLLRAVPRRTSSQATAR